MCALCPRLDGVHRWKRAAGKNAFTLIGQHKYEQAAAFFLFARQYVTLHDVFVCDGLRASCLCALLCVVRVDMTALSRRV